MSDVWAKGGEGGEEVANEVLAVLAEKQGKFKPIYDAAMPIKEKIETIAREIYGADGVDYTGGAEKAIAQIDAMGLGETPVCIAKTQYSFSDDPTKLGPPHPASGSRSGTSTPRRAPASWSRSPATS